MKRALPLVLLLIGCGSGRTTDLDAVIAKIKPGMTELQVTQAVGAPSKVNTENGDRVLQYDGADGKSILIRMNGNIVVSLEQE